MDLEVNIIELEIEQSAEPAGPELQAQLVHFTALMEAYHARYESFKALPWSSGYLSARQRYNQNLGEWQAIYSGEPEQVVTDQTPGFFWGGALFIF